MPTKLLLVSCGNSDLQAIFDHKGHKGRVEMGKETRRALHCALLDGRASYSMDERAKDLKPLKNQLLWWTETGAQFGKSLTLAEQSGLEPGLLRLVPAKLAGIRDVFSKNTQPDTVLVFNTCRTTRENEPVAAGPLLAKWLAEVLGLQHVKTLDDFGAGKTASVNYIDDAVPADGPNGESINPVAIQQIDDALRRITADVSTVTFALGGGIPAYRDEIRACARYRFPDAKSFHDCVRTEHGGVEKSHILPLPPSQSMRIRSAAHKLIHRGDFHGAWTLANQLSGQDSEPNWIEPLEKAFLYISGRLPPLTEDLPHFISGIADPKAPRCLLPALRTEAALRGGRWAEAVLWTFAVYEAAMTDAIGRLDFIKEIDELGSQVTVGDGRQVPSDFTESNNKAPRLLKSEDNRKYNRKYKYSTGKDYDERWQDQFDDPVKTALAAFRKALRTKTDREGRDVTLRDVRNTIMHSALPQDNMEWVEKGFIKAGLWVESSSQAPGARFLENENVKTLCNAARCNADDFGEPGKLYDGFVNGLCMTMKQHRYDAS